MAPPTRQFPIARAAAGAAILVWAAGEFRRQPVKVAAQEPLTEAVGCPELVDVVREPDGHQRMGDGPLQPLKGQQKATGAPPRCADEFAVPVHGYCWLSLEQRPPNCPKGSVAHEGRCLLPLSAKPRLPTSIHEAPP